MLESLRSDYIARLMEGIARIGPGPMFERFGAKFLDHHLDVTLVHRGLNVELSPVGRTIDSYDDASLTGAEYSIEQGYFAGGMAKACGDLNHVLCKHPNVVEVYLLSSRRAPDGVIPAYTQRVTKWPSMRGRKLHLYDARRIAEVIVDDLLLSNAAIDDLVEHLPALVNIIDDAAAALAMPRPDARHMLRPRVDQMISNELAANGPVAVLSGIGGLGKSDSAIAYAAAHGANYKMPLWIDGERVRRVEDLKAVELWRGGITRNVEGLMKSRRCLVVIDDLSDAIDRMALARICGPGTHVIVTRRAVAVGDLEIPLLDEGEARAILDRDLAEPCPPHVFTQVIQTIGGHPLSLALVNRVVGDGATWDDIADDCAGVPNLARGDQRLADRLLGRLRPALLDLLQLFEWARQGIVDLRFLRDAVGALGVSRLRQYGLTAPDRPTTLKLHDIVQASVMVQKWLTPERATEFDNRFEAFLENLIAEEGHTLRIVASTMQAKLEALVRTDPRPAFIVALLEIWKPRETQPASLPDPAGVVERLAAAGVPPSRAQVRAIVETIEGLYRYDKTVDYKGAGDKLRARLPIFDRLAAIDGLDARSLTEVRHHRAKAMKILGMDDEAQATFEEILAGPHPLFASRLQLVRLYGRSPETVDRAAALADETLTAASEPGRVSSNVMLAMLQALPSTSGDWRAQLFDKHSDLIEREIILAAEAGADDALSAFAAAARHWSWHDRDRLRRVFAALQIDDPGALDDKVRAAAGELFAQVAKRDEEIDADYQARALGYYQAIEAPDDFTKQKHAQLLVEMARPAEAESVIQQIGAPKPFAFYWLSKAQLAQGKGDEALASIERALEGLTAGQRRFRSAFLAQRFETRQALGDHVAAREDLQLACRECEDAKYKASLDRQLALLENE